MIPLASLPDEEIRRYLKKKKKEEVLTAATVPVQEDVIIDLNYEKLSAEEREQLNLKNKVLDDWIRFREEDARNGRNRAEADEHYVRILQLQYPDIRLSLRTIQRWDKIRREKGEAALVDRRGKHGNHPSKMDKEVFDIFEYYYLDESRKSASLCRTLTELELKKKGIQTEIPEVRTFQRWTGKIPEPVVQYYRFGAKAYKDKCGPYIHRTYDDLHSNDIWVCDNHTFDVIVWKDEKPLRVYLTAFLDIRSRKMVGYYVTLTPSADATLYALRRGIEQYGIPKRILADNGREFLTFDLGGRGFRKKSKHAELDPATIMDRLQIDFRTALVRNARAKIIERSFLTIKEEFSKLFQAYTGGNTQERPERLKYIEKDPDKLTVLEDFEAFLEYYIEGIYNNRPHRGLGMRGMTPNQVFARCLVEQRKASPEELNIMLLRSTRLQKITRAGVKLNFYGKDVFFIDEDMTMNHQNEKVYVRYNPSDLETVRIYDEQDRFLMTAVQDKSISYFASKEEIAEKMKEQRHYENIVKAYKKDKGIKATEVLDLMMEKAAKNMQTEEKLDPAIIRILRSPDAEFNQICIQHAVGGEVIDWSIANRNMRKYQEEDK